MISSGFGYVRCQPDLLLICACVGATNPSAPLWDGRVDFDVRVSGLTRIVHRIRS